MILHQALGSPSSAKRISRVGIHREREGATAGPLPTITSEARLRILELADELASIHRRHTFDAAVPKVSAEGPAFLVRVLRRVLRASDSTPSKTHHPSSLKIDDPLDTSWSHERPQFSHIAHVFHQEWHGVRAAAGYLPGTKLAITADRPLSVENLSQACAAVLSRKAETVLFHGWSQNSQMLAAALREAGCRKLLVVWHGNTAQFMNPFEIEQVSKLLALHSRGAIDGLASVKPDLYLLSERFHRRVLLNVGPSLRDAGHAFTDAPSNTALIPVPNDWRKNYFTNIFACNAANVTTIFLTTPLPRSFTFPLRAKIVEFPRPTRAELFALLPQVRILLNASLSECQPMTALEGLAHGVPCVTGPLALGSLDDHPYQRLAQVKAPDTLGPVTNAVRRFLEQRSSDPRGLDEMMKDYRASLEAEAWARLGEFIQ